MVVAPPGPGCSAQQDPAAGPIAQHCRKSSNRKPAPASDTQRNRQLVERNFRERMNYIRLRQKALVHRETFAQTDGRSESLGRQHALILLQLRLWQPHSFRKRKVLEQVQCLQVSTERTKPKDQISSKV